LEAAEWDEDEQLWRIETSKGAMTAEILIAAQGPLSDPSLPEVPGIESFEGKAFHSAQWDHDHDLTGERVAVIGTGASAIQFVPEIQPKVAKLHVLQRTPPWVIPHRNRPMKRWERAIYRIFPPAQLAMRAGIYWARESFVLQFRHRAIGRLLERIPMTHMRRQIKDPELRRKLTPDYSIGCKRILPTNEWYPALAKPNVEVVAGGLTEVRPRSVVAEDGSEREVDTIIFGTGFHVTDVPIADRVTGRDGRTLTETWQGSMQAYKGTTVAGFPNLFFLVGPNTGLGHTSIVFIIESQIAYVLDALGTMRRHGARTLEVREEAQAAYNAELDRMTEGTVWVSGGCSSYYIDRNGHNSALWPTYTWPFRQRTKEFDAPAYALGVREREPLATAA
jgi:cation diffusion facilitator CzcD-associated flavoprotein CzcO